MTDTQFLKQNNMAKKKSLVKKVSKEKQSLDEIFDMILPLLKKYEPPMTQVAPGPPMKVGKKRAYGLWTGKAVEFMGRKFPSIYFAGMIIQKDFLGFYYFPVYGKPELKKGMKPELLKLLKGKSCFHIKGIDAELKKQIKDELENGFKTYKKLGGI